MMMPPIITHGQQSNCIDPRVQGAEVLAHKQLDVNQDGSLDDVVIYGNDERRVLVVANQPTLNCKVILNDGLTSRQIYNGERRPVTVTQIELVDLTGDGQPELHVGLEGTYFFRQSGAFHSIYMLRGDAMERIFVSDSCLPMSSFEIRVTSDGAKTIYLDEDRVCDPPSSRRDYDLYQWNTETARFKLIENGQVDKWTPDPFWDAVLSVFIIPVVIVIASVVMLGVAIVWYERKKNTKSS
jgi:hypothetical protein